MASEMLPVTPLSALEIETKLRVRRVKSIAKLSITAHPAPDERSLVVERNFANEDSRSETDQSAFRADELSWRDLEGGTCSLIQIIVLNCSHIYCFSLMSLFYCRSGL